MAAFMADSAYDALLSVIKDNTTQLFICSSLPVNYTEASATYKLGIKASPTIGALADGTVNGRRFTVASISDGSVTGNGTAGYWALCSGSVLLAAGQLSASQVVTSGNTFTLAAFDVSVADAA